jgi:hypothetical protein
MIAFDGARAYHACMIAPQVILLSIAMVQSPSALLSYLQWFC